MLFEKGSIYFFLFENKDKDFKFNVDLYISKAFLLNTTKYFSFDVCLKLKNKTIIPL